MALANKSLQDNKIGKAALEYQADMSNVQFLPQRPYFMPQMTLRDQITSKFGAKVETNTFLL